MIEEETEDFKFESYDVCEAVLSDDDTFECTLTRHMRNWAFPAWEVRITRGQHLGCTTHVREEQLTFIERPESGQARAHGAYGYQ